MRRTVFFRLWTGIVASAALGFAAPGLGVLPEHVRADPFGGIIEADRSGVSAPARSITLEGTWAAYVSCPIVVSVPEGGAYRLEIASFGTGLEADLYREGFHLLAANVRYYPDALVPARMPYRPRMPEPDNRIAGQTVQAFWLDLWIGASVRPGEYRSNATLSASGATVSVPLTIKVWTASIGLL